MSQSSQKLSETRVGSSQISAETRCELLRIARSSIERSLREGKHGKASRSLQAQTGQDPVLFEPRGVFVTLKQEGQLRGCIGYTEPHKPLGEAVAAAAISAATQDPRFSPVTLEQLDSIHIEISVLSVPEPVGDVEEIVTGRNGLIVRQGFRTGLLLPQVATEYDLDRVEFLEHTCMKAGLPSDAWQEGAEVLRFSAEVFGE